VALLVVTVKDSALLTATFFLDLLQKLLHLAISGQRLHDMARWMSRLLWLEAE